VTGADDDPVRCPACGSTEIRERRETGGGWRRVVRCADCGARVRPVRDGDGNGDRDSTG
jgi:DNA-directed RNA polymerase subunit RPC12/RpoP